ncbi:hypothetical protein R1sor_014934 [Riccia sorocarpa]|uniref:GTP cyclohydrolase 1 n=1 Tax=Riccia sorocarpa TaxID=122646 RepID=A0ABD3HEM3_9MARC
MPCSSLPVSNWEDERDECAGCEPDSKVPMESFVDRKASSESQMAAAVKILLRGIGEDVEREGILKTPLRVAKAFQSFVSGYGLSPETIIGEALFTVAGTDGGTGGGSGGMVVVRKIDSFALCDTCLLPFRLRSHVAYIPSGQRVVGLSKLPRVVSMLSKRLQNPQKLGNELVQALHESFGPLGVAAAVESWHLEWPGTADRNGGPTGGGCPEDRLGFGWVPTTVYAARGKFESWDEFLGIVEIDGIEIQKPSLGMINSSPGKEKSCPFFPYSGNAECLDSIAALTQAVESLVRAEGEEISRKDLELTISRYVNWLVSATEGRSQELVHGSVKDTDFSSLTLHVNGNGWTSHGRSGHVNDIQQDVVVGVTSNQCGYSNGLVYAGPNGVVNGHSNGVHYVGAIECNNGHSNGVSHGVTDGEVTAVESSEEHNIIGHLKVNGFVNGYRNSMSHGSSGATNGFGGTGDVCNGIHHGEPNGISNGYSNGTVHTVPSNILGDYSKEKIRTSANGVNSSSNGCLHFEIPRVPSLDDRAGSIASFELDLPLSSLCEHHLLPFSGVAHVGYLGGKGKLERLLVLKIVRMFSRRLQVQERLTRQIAESIASLADFPWIMVVVEANHMCIVSRGAEKLGSTTATVATVGKLANDGALRAAFLKTISKKGAKRTNF